MRISRRKEDPGFENWSEEAKVTLNGFPISIKGVETADENPTIEDRAKLGIWKQNDGYIETRTRTLIGRVRIDLPVSHYLGKIEPKEKPADLPPKNPKRFDGWMNTKTGESYTYDGKEWRRSKEFWLEVTIQKIHELTKMQYHSVFREIHDLCHASGYVDLS